MTAPLLWTRQQDTLGVLGLAINACGERDGSPDTVERIQELLEAARDLWVASPDLVDEGERFLAGRLVLRLVMMADVEAVTAAA